MPDRTSSPVTFETLNAIIAELSARISALEAQLKDHHHYVNNTGQLTTTTYDSNMRSTSR